MKFYLVVILIINGLIILFINSRIIIVFYSKASFVSGFTLQIRLEFAYLNNSKNIFDGVV
jgi:hypothetical protein